ncbi:MAG: cell division protein FtsQ [Paraburkholderia sp.]|nr:MAG: cell division protein FtsQ [Paraburkholderia sp.]
MTNRTEIRTEALKQKPSLGGRGACLLALTAMIAAAPLSAMAAADDVASLYGPQPPADATYLRVVNLSTRAAKVALPGGARAIELAPGAATALDVVRPGTPLGVEVDGAIAAQEAAAARVAGSDTTGSTITVAIERDGARGWRALPIAAPAASADALRAQLRLFNFVDGCDGKVALERNAGTVVFDHVAPAHAAARSINPVAATLVAVCGDAASAPFALPRLAAGRSYTLILSGTAAHPVLGGVPDTLEWPGRR